MTNTISFRHVGGGNRLFEDSNISLANFQELEQLRTFKGIVNPPDYIHLGI